MRPCAATWFAAPGRPPLPPAAMQDLAQARCPRCGCDLFGTGASAPGDIPDPRNLF